MSDTGGGGVGPWAAAGIMALTPLGLGLRWVVNWLSGRHEKRLASLEKGQANLVAKVLILGQALMEVTADLRHHAPASSSLVRAEAALKRAFPLDPRVPGDMLDLVAQMDERS